MWWRLPRAEFDRQKGEGNRLAMQSLVERGEIPGILGYVEDVAAGWCSVAPRGVFPRLERARTLKPPDDQPVWSVVCLFVRREYRRQGFSAKLLEAAAAYVRGCGGRLLEGYPTDPKQPQAPAPFLYTGITSAFVQAGFEEVARPGARRIMRRPLSGHRET